MYLDALYQGLLNVINLGNLGLLCIGVGVGWIVSFLPGLGGVVGMSVILPFVWGMGPTQGLMVLIGVIAVMRTADTIPAVLFAVPGTAGAQATVIDGYSMARKGEAARALGAALTASTVGAFIGAIILSISVPIGRPLVLAFGSPEFFMLIVLGLMMTATLSGQAPIRGIVAALFGLLLASIGGAMGAPVFRYTFDIPYLSDGVPLLAVALGLFALPEMIDLLAGGGTISGSTKLGKGLLTGVKDVFRNFFLVARVSALGTFIGFLPGLGATPASWMAYGHAVQSAKDKTQFGKGDVRGIVAPESANNAADCGALIPSLLFGIPGSPMMAIFIFAMSTMDIIPGPRLLTTQLSVPYTIAWAMAAGAIIGLIVSLLLVRPIAHLTTVRIQALVPFVVLAVMLATFQATRDWGDLIALLGFSIIGWFMKRTNWPRPPILIGFVLGNMAEKYLWTAVARYGATWLLHPWVIIIGILSVLPLILGKRKAKKEAGGEQSV